MMTLTPRAKTQVKGLLARADNPKTALRVLGQRLVSPEVAYIQRTLGPTATQLELDKSVAKVRKMPWASIMQPE